jgi:hypothetical protein
MIGTCGLVWDIELHASVLKTCLPADWIYANASSIYYLRPMMRSVLSMSRGP